MRLLVHVAGEADLLLNSLNRSPDMGAERVAKRCHDLVVALAAPDGHSAVRQMLAGDAWKDESFTTPAPSPLLGAIDTLDATPDLEVVVLGTTQNSAHPLYTLPIAETLASVLNVIAAHDATYPLRKATAVGISGMTEQAVVDTLTSYLGELPPYDQALVTWGSGSTALSLGVLTALSHAGLPWKLVLTSDSPNQPPTYGIVDPLTRLDVDPVAGVFIRWRMFAALDDLSRNDPPVVRLTADQRELVHRAAERHRAGLEARDCTSLRAVLADTVVRRDGSASLAVRRYVSRKYEELLEIDQVEHPWAENLLVRYEKPGGGGPPLGAKLRQIKHDRHDDPVVCASVDLPSYRWLHSLEVDSLQNIGKGSHNLRPPAPCDSRIIGDYLSRNNADEGAWQKARLPEPPVTPGDSVLAVWSAGVRVKEGFSTVGQQLSGGLPTVVSDHLGVQKTRLRAVIFAVDDGQGSREHAEADARRINSATDELTGEPRDEAWVESIKLCDTDEVAVERAIESRLSRDTAALLLIPTGAKPVVRVLLQAMRRIGARHGLPLFVRQLADPAIPGVYRDVYLWPALTGGDLPLLNAAKGALRALELDVAWRLLAASAVDKNVTDKAQRLAAAFASRGPLHGRGAAPASDNANWTTGMITQRLELVEAALAYANAPAERIRLLVLAADALEASIAAATKTPIKPTKKPIKPKERYKKFREQLGTQATSQNTRAAATARVLLLLNEARDQAPITHGVGTDIDAVTADAADRLAATWQLAAAQADMLPRDVSTLLRRAVAAAAERGFGRPDRADSLLRLQEEIIADIDRAIDLRRPVVSFP